MPCLPRSAYNDLSGELAANLDGSLRAFARRHGLPYDAGAYLSQSSTARNGMHEVMGFALDVWPSEGDSEGGEPLLLPEAELLPFTRPPSLAAPVGLRALAAGLVAAILLSGSQPSAEHLAVADKVIVHDNTLSVTGPIPFMADAAG